MELVQQWLAFLSLITVLCGLIWRIESRFKTTEKALGDRMDQGHKDLRIEIGAAVAVANQSTRQVLELKAEVAKDFVQKDAFTAMWGSIDGLRDRIDRFLDRDPALPAAPPRPARASRPRRKH